MTTSSRILIVGGGAGGLELATRLGQAVRKLPGVSILLIDKHPFHVWKPLFHEVKWLRGLSMLIWMGWAIVLMRPITDLNFSWEHCEDWTDSTGRWRSKQSVPLPHPGRYWCPLGT